VGGGGGGVGGGGGGGDDWCLSHMMLCSASPRDIALRRPEIQFPPVFDRALMVNEAKLIRQMLQHDPKLRPSAADILKRCFARSHMQTAYLR